MLTMTSICEDCGAHLRGAVEAVMHYTRYNRESLCTRRQTWKQTRGRRHVG